MKKLSAGALAFFLLAVAAATPLPSGETSGKPETGKKKDPSTVTERLVRNLADGSEAARRAAAEALLETGPAAVPEIRKLLDHPDLEVRERASGLLKRMGETVPASRMEADRLVALMKRTRKPHEGAEAVLRLRQLGRDGLAAWIDLFPARRLPPGSLSIALKEAVPALSPGETFRIEAVITNRSEDPAWISMWDALTAIVDGTAPIGSCVEPYDPEKTDGTVMMLSDFYDIVLLAPGESRPVTLQCRAPVVSGRYALTGHYEVRGEFAEVLESCRAKARALLAAPGPVTFKECDGLIRGSPDILIQDCDWGQIEVRDRNDPAR